VLFCSAPSEELTTSMVPLALTVPATFIAMAPNCCTDSNRSGLPAVVSTLVSVVLIVTGIPSRLIVMVTSSLVVTSPPVSDRV
jgi:hypothetical protein